MLKEESFVIV